MKLLITGATGFIGTHLSKRLIKNGDSVSALVRPTSNFNSIAKEVKVLEIPSTQMELESLFDREKFDGVIHLASSYMMAHKPEDIKQLIDSNITYGTKIVDAAANKNVRFFINTGSFVQHYNQLPYSPINLYAATKQAFQDILKYYIEASQINIITLELFNTFGPNDTRKKIFNLWDQISRTGESLDMSAGEQVIDISYIDNIIDGFCHTIDLLDKDSKQSLNGKTFTLPSAERMSLRELAKTFSETINRPLNINFGALPYRPLEIMDPIYGQPLPGWKPTVELKEGIKKTFSQ